MEETKPQTKTQKRKTLAELFAEPCAVAINDTQLHQAFMLKGAGTESSLHPGRPGLKDIKLVYHPGYGLIGYNKGRYFLSPAPNVIVAHE